MKGAVLFGVSRDAFASRKLRYTYGISVSRKFDESNPIHKGLGENGYTTFMINGDPVIHVNDMFYEFATVGFTSCVVNHFW